MSKQSIIINIEKDGNANCVWTDNLPLDSLGILNVKRASTVEFNDASQEWEVRFIDPNSPNSPGAVFFSHKSRAACLQWEVETINQKLTAGIY